MAENATATLAADYEARKTELTALSAKMQEGLSDEEYTRAEALVAECEGLKEKIEKATTLAAKMTAIGNFAATPVLPIPFPNGGQQQPAQPPATPLQAMGYQGYAQRNSLNFAQPEEPRSFATVAKNRATSFNGGQLPDGRWISADEKAYRFGMWFMAACLKRPKALDFCQKQGIPTIFISDSGSQASVNLAQVEEIGTAGGFLVPIEFDNDIIVLRELYGVFRRNARVVTMRSDTRRIPRRTGGLTAYYVGENDLITESQKGWDSVNLTAKKLAVLAKYSSELDEDAIIDIGNDLADEIAYAFAKAEDNAGFLGDGTSTYGGIIGLKNQFQNLTATFANIAGMVIGAAGGWASFALADFNSLAGKLPQYAMRRNPRWYCHLAFFKGTMERLMLAAGGVTALEVAMGRREPVFLGFPVEITQIMPATTAIDDIPCYFGDLGLAAKMGDRRQTTIAVSEHFNFANDELVIRGTERFDIVVHDVGNQSSTATSRVPGPIVALQTAHT